MLVVVLLAGMLYVLRPVATGIILGALLVLITWRPFLWLRGKVGLKRPGLAAMLATLALTLVFLVPLALVTYQLVLQASGALAWLSSRSGQMGGAEGLLHRLPSWLQETVAPEAQRLGSTVAPLLGRVAQALPVIASGLSSLVIQAFLTLVAIFYFFRDGEGMVAFARRASPFSPEETEAFMGEIHSLAHGLFYGNAVTALAHGAVAGLGYVVLGAPSAVLLASLTALASFVPVIGTSIIWAPVALGLGLEHGWVRGVMMLLWGLVLVGGIDNVLRPLVTKGQVRLHALLVFASLFGGIAVFGLEGLVLGPILVGLGATALRRVADRREQPPQPLVPVTPVPAAPGAPVTSPPPPLVEPAPA
jgi:predicted PurR-regulated permease PerM